MFRTCTLLLAGLALAARPLSVHAQEDETRAVVIDAMKAHGGKEALRKYLGSQAKYKGTVEAMGVTVKVENEDLVAMLEAAFAVLAIHAASSGV